MIFKIMIFLAVILLLVTVIKDVKEWRGNKKAPHYVVGASLISKRKNETKNRHTQVGDVSGARGDHMKISTSYYITFQVTGGDCIEFKVHEKEYGMVREGEYGVLSFQGTKYLGFHRT